MMRQYVIEQTREIRMSLKSMHNDFDFLLLDKKDDGINIERTKKINEQ
ncbi:hypothetical protein PROVRETT_07857, partial [Providencia rettgeri DSM 1131]